MSKSIDTATSDCRLVRYGVYHPTKGWYQGWSPSWDGWDRAPFLFTCHTDARAYAIKHSAQLVMFDVTPCLRSWPGEEPKAPCEPNAKETK